MSDIKRLKPAMREIQIYARLMNQEWLNRDGLAEEYDISSKTISRYIRDINTTLRNFPDFVDHRAVEISPKGMGKDRHYEMKMNDSDQDQYLDQNLNYALIKLILGSRVFNNQEAQILITTLLKNLGLSDREELEQTLSVERKKYVPVSNNKELLKWIKMLRTAIKAGATVNIEYLHQNGDLVHEPILPRSIVYNNSHFYCIAFSGASDNQHVERGYRYRIDRIQEITASDQKLKLPQMYEREADEKQQYLYEMRTGRSMRVQIEYYGNVEIVKDRFPDAKVLRQFEATDTHPAGNVLEFRALEEGALMWVLGQGSATKILAPISLKKRVMAQLAATQHLY